MGGEGCQRRRFGIGRLQRLCVYALYNTLVYGTMHADREVKPCTHLLFISLDAFCTCL